MKFTLAAVQIASKLGKVAENMATAESLIARISGRPGVAVLPELALTGYAFNSPAHIRPFLEAQNGLSTNWALRMAEKYNLNVCIGYPEISDGKTYNSAVLCSPTRILAHYRKSHLYNTDLEWGCSESPEGFIASGPWPELPVKTQMGICMDLNPKDFVAPWDAFEFARSIKQNDSGLVLCPMAWLAGSTRDPDPKLIAYWRSRLPVNVPIVISNRYGSDGDTVYGGSSTIFSGKRSVSVAGEGIVEHEIDLPLNTK